MNRNRVRAVLVLVATFLLGVAAGGAALRAISEDRFRRELHRPFPEAREQFMLEAMTRRLGLSDGQRGKIEAIFAKHRGERRRIMQKCAPDHEALRARVEAEIDSVLTPAQRAKHDRLRARHGRKHGEPRPSSPH